MRQTVNVNSGIRQDVPRGWSGRLGAVRHGIRIFVTYGCRPRKSRWAASESRRLLVWDLISRERERICLEENDFEILIKTAVWTV